MDFLMNFVMRLLISTHWKGENYDSILVIIDWLSKMVYYEPIKIIINALGLAKVILDVVVQYHDLSNSIVSYKDLLLISKFWSLLYYFLSIKQRLLITFYP